jgi:hypothetical protein
VLSRHRTAESTTHRNNLTSVVSKHSSVAHTRILRDIVLSLGGLISNFSGDARIIVNKDKVVPVLN